MYGVVDMKFILGKVCMGGFDAPFFRTEVQTHYSPIVISLCFVLELNRFTYVP